MEADQTRDHKPGETSNMQIAVINKDNTENMIKARIFWYEWLLWHARSALPPCNHNKEPNKVIRIKE